MQAEAYAPVLDALARAPMTFDELARAPECAKLDRVRLRQAVFGMAALGNIVPALPATGEDALATAIITRPEHMPEQTKKELDPIIGKYLLTPE